MQLNKQKEIYRYIFLIIISALVNAFLMQLSHWVTITPEKIRIFWPVLPFAIFSISILGLKASFGIWLGAFFYFWWVISGRMMHLDSVLSAGLVSFVVTIQAYLGVFLLQRWIGDFPKTPKIINLLKVIVITVLVGWMTPLSEYLIFHYSALNQPIFFINSYLTWYVGACLTNIAILPLLMVIKMKFSEKQIDTWIPKIIFSFGILLSTLFYVNSLGRENAILEDQFASFAEQKVAHIRQSLLNGYHDVGLLQRYFISSEYVSRSEFIDFTEPFLFGAYQSSGLQSMVWIPRISPDERMEIEAAARKEGEDHFSFYTLSSDGQKIDAPDKVEYYPVYYEQTNVVGQELMGLDLGAIPAFQTKLNDARDMGNGVLLDCASILEPQGVYNKYLVLLPLYDPFENPDTVQERRELFTGFVGGLYILDDWLASSVEPGSLITADEYIFDEAGGPESKLIYFSPANSRIDPEDVDFGLQAESVKNGTYAQYELGVLDVTWLYIMSTEPGYFAANRTKTPLLILMICLIITFSISIYADKNYKDMLALADSQEKYMLLAENVNDVIWTYDIDDDRFLYISPSIQKLCGYPAEEIIHQKLDHVISRATIDHLAAVLPGRLEKFKQEYEYAYLDSVELYDRDGEIIYAETSTNAFLNQKTKHIELYGVIRDITWRKQAEEKLRQREALLQISQKLSKVGGWEWNIERQLMYWTEEVYHIHDMPPGSGMLVPEEAIALSLKCYPMPDRERIGTAFDRCAQKGISYDLQSPFTTTQGRKIWIRTNAQAEWENGKITKLRGTIMDISDQKRLEKELEEERNSLAKRVEDRTADLRRSTIRLEKALVAKDEFLANMSHELRTPLTAILGLSELLHTESYGALNDRQKKYLFTIQESGEHLLALINDILDLAKATAGKLDLQYDDVDVAGLCQSSLAFIRPMAESKQIEVSFNLEDEGLVIQGDGRRIRQILVNLLNNAVKFTPDRGHVELHVSLDKESEEVQFLVSDDGIGIAEEDMRKLFQPFTQLDSGLNRNYEGSGLGLALVRKLVDLHQGSLSLSSTGISGEGSTFTVTLPWKVNDVDQVDSFDAMGLQGSEGLDESVVTVQNAGRTILLVEDNQANITTISDYLTLAGYRVILALNGLQAIEMAGRYNPDVILMDIYMPVMDGLEAIRQLRSDERFADTVILALTALAMPGDRDRCLAAGADAFLSKPIQLKELLRTIQSYD